MSGQQDLRPLELARQVFAPVNEAVKLGFLRLV
jgi:hypothetical protein